MAVSLIDLAKNYLTSEVLHKMGGELGETPDQVEKAVEAGIPTLLAGLLKMVSTSGANHLIDMLKQEPPDLGRTGGLDDIFGNLGGLLSSGSIGPLIKYGKDLLSHLFAGKLDAILELITKASGIKASSAS